VDSAYLIHIPLQIDTNDGISEWVIAPADLTIVSMSLAWGQTLSGTSAVTVEIGGTAVAGLSISVTGAQGQATSHANSLDLTPTDQVAEGGAIEIVATAATTGTWACGFLVCRVGRN